MIEGKSLKERVKVSTLHVSLFASIHFLIRP